MFRDIRRLFALLPGRIRARWGLLVPLSALAAALEALAALLIVAWIGLVTSPTHPPDTALATLGGLLVGASEKHRLVVFSAFVVGFFAFKSGVALAFTYFAARAAATSTVHVSSELLRRYLAADYEFFFNRDSAGLATNLVGASERVFAAIARAGLELCSEVLLLAAVLIVLVYAAPASALVAALLLTSMLLALLRVTRGLFVSLGKAVQKLNRSLLQVIQHSVGAIKEVKLLQKEHFFLELFTTTRAELARTQALRTTFDVAPRLMLEVLFVTIIAALVVVLASAESEQNQTMSTLALFAFAGFRILPSLHRITIHVNLLRFGRGALNDIERDWNEVARFVHGTVEGPAAEPCFQREIRFERVTYRYPAALRPALQDVTTVVRAGESLGIVGSTGAGKSTLAGLVLGLLSPSSGTVMVDGRTLSKIRSAWYPQLGYVPQDVFLLDASIAANVAFGVPPAAVDPARLERALNAAQASSFVDSLPQGWETPVGERGIKLSGGQKQRLAIARALYRDPAVLVFDEATSALDHATELELASTIRGLSKTRTLIIIAHRMTTVRECDRLLLLEDGKLIAEGDYDTLLRTNPKFRAIAGDSVSVAS